MREAPPGHSEDTRQPPCTERLAARAAITQEASARFLGTKLKISSLEGPGQITAKSSLGWLVCPVVLHHLGGLWLLRCGQLPTRLWWVCCLTTANVASGGWWLGFTPPQGPLGADSDPKPQDKEALLAAQPITRIRALFAPAVQQDPRSSCLENRLDNAHSVILLPSGRTLFDCPHHENWYNF